MQRLYYLQSREDGGVAAALENCELPAIEDAGGGELLRISDLLPFFADPLKQKEPHLMEQYEQAFSRLPDVTDFEAAVLRAVLVLSAIKNPDIAPTTSFLSFCLCDTDREDLGADALHSGLARLSDAHAIWKNEATDVWNFVTERGLSQDLEKELDHEKALVPHDKASGELLRTVKVLREEITDRLGDAELDPCDAGIVRRVSFRLLDPVKGDKAIDSRNPALGGSDESWLSAIVYLAAVDTIAELDISRKLAEVSTRGAVYVVFPIAPLALSVDKSRELIAVRQLIEKKDSQSHAYEVLKNKLTKLREDLRAEFGKSFGNEGLRTGTTVLKVGTPAKLVPVSSWGQLLPSINTDLETVYHEQPRVRCGSFNEWQHGWQSRSGAQWNKIENIAEAILKFDEKPEFHNEYFNFSTTSQEAAIIDGVLVENGFFAQNTATGKWELVVPTADSPSEVMREVLSHLASRSNADKPFLKLYDKLIDPPYGVPNGIIPLFVALAFRAEPSRIGLYHRPRNNWERVDSEIHKAIVKMAQFPDRYQTRYSKLSPKQRWIFRAIGSEFNLQVPESSVAEQIEEACKIVSSQLRKFVSNLPEAALTLPDLSEAQKDILKVLRGGVPPQPTLLADHLIRWAREDHNARIELEETKPVFPATIKIWRDFRERLDSQIEGHRAPIRRQVDELGKNREGVVEMLQRVASFAGPDDQAIAPILERLAGSESGGDLSEEIVAAIVNKDVRQLDAEDFGRASGKLEVWNDLAPPAGNITVVLPDGTRRKVLGFTHIEACQQIRLTIKGWQELYSLTSEQVAAVILEVVATPEPPQNDTPKLDVLTGPPLELS